MRTYHSGPKYNDLSFNNIQYKLSLGPVLTRNAVEYLVLFFVRDWIEIREKHGFEFCRGRTSVLNSNKAQGQETPVGKAVWEAKEG